MIGSKFKFLSIMMTMLLLTGGYGFNMQGKAISQKTKSSNESIFIYSTHNRETYSSSNFTEKQPQLDATLDAQENVTLVGAYLAEALREKGTNVEESKEDYYDMNSVSYAGLYDLSRKSVKDALKKNPELSMVFDIQNTSRPKEQTTVKVNEKNTAKIYFVVDQSHPNWKMNLDFAKKLSKTLENQYPGVFGGITEKKAIKSWNQDLSPQSVLVQVGGKENTFVEAYRAADLLADVIADVTKNN